MFEGYTNADKSAHIESVTETPWVKKYVRATIAGADPQGNIRSHEGVVTRDFGKEMEVVDPQPNWRGFAKSPWPKYVSKRCQKEGAEEIPVPWAKAKGVEEIRQMLDTRM